MPETAIFDHYEVMTREDGTLVELGRGSMGITYKAYDTRLRIPVALKVINGTYLNSEIARQRFVREARSAARLRHRHVASVFHLGSEGDTWFYAMEYIDGETLESLIRRQGPLNPRMALTITAQVARALNAAAQHGLVHRDIKPANLMLVKEDDELIARVIDFGLAKVSVAGEGEDAVTVSMGGFVGTFAFASPEQLEEKEIDGRSDIYSLGVTLWYMLAGQVPFMGSMAQVVNQHLSKPPPFEKFEHLPDAVSTVLRGMLEKDRSDRFQTAAELRTAIETALEQIADAPPAVATPSAPAEESVASGSNAAAHGTGDTNFEVGAVLSRKYRIVEVLGEADAGRAFRATNTDTQTDVQMLVLRPEIREDPVASHALQCEVAKLTEVRHPNLLGIRAFEAADQASFVVMEWTEGFSLVELLRARRELKSGEAGLLLRQAAAGVDHALSLGLTGLGFNPRHVFLHFPQSPDKTALLRTPVTQWPVFELKLYPLGFARELGSSQTWAGEQTMVGGTPGASKGEDMRLRYLQSLAALIYELLGGARPSTTRGGQTRSGAPRYAPLSTLSEEGNEVLKRALDPARSFSTARDFCDALTALEGLQARRHETRHDAKPSTEAPAATSNPVKPPAPPVPPAPPAPTTSRRLAVPATKPRPRTGLYAAVGAAVLVVSVGIGFMILHSGGNSSNLSDSPGPAQPSDTSPPTNPPPGSSRSDSFTAAAKVAQDLDDKGDWAKSLAAWVRAGKDFPESGAAKDRLENLLNRVRARPNPIAREEFKAAQEPIVEAAKLGVVSGMVLLADNLREREAATAMSWYSAAAGKGHPQALSQLGLMYWNGTGTGSPDLPKAVKCFQDAADKGDSTGRFALGECYLSGKGVPTKDEKRALELLRSAAQSGDTMAMNRLGDCLAHGIGGKVDFAEAARLFTQASERGNLEALGNLGVLYMNEEGAAPNLKKGAELFEKGARAGNGFCMRLFARCLETGMGAEKNPGQAENWYRAGAKAGDRRAMAWCRQHGISLAQK